MHYNRNNFNPSDALNRNNFKVNFFQSFSSANLEIDDGGRGVLVLKSGIERSKPLSYPE